MSCMLVFTAIGHFVYTHGMSLMLPSYIPFRHGVIYLTGIIELFAAVGLLIPRLQHLTAWFLIIFFVLILPANIHAALNKIDFQTGTTNGNGIAYLWFRVPLQILFIWWTYYFGIRKEVKAKDTSADKPAISFLSGNTL